MMAKRNQILRVPQKKYTEEMVEEMPVLGLPHENLIPPGRDAAGDTAANTIDNAGSNVSDVDTPGPRASNDSNTVSGDEEAHKATRESQSRPTPSTDDIGDTGYTSITRTSPLPTSDEVDDGQDSASLSLKGRTRDVWNYFCRTVKEQKTEGNRVRTSRRQIQKESGVGSLNTIDSAIATLQGRGWLRVNPLPGSNEGYEYEVLLERASASGTETPRFIAETLQRATSTIKRRGGALTPDHLNKWSKIAHQINRLVDEFK